jgi:hypothetical protein
MFEVTSAWQSTFPGAHAGVLAMRNVYPHPKGTGGLLCFMDLQIGNELKVFEIQSV